MKNYASNSKGLHYFKIPDKYYTDKYVLIDVQHDRGLRDVLYIFRNVENNEKEFHYESADSNYFYIDTNNSHHKSESLIDARKTKVRSTTKGLDKENISIYESDVNIALKHSIDYYYSRKTPEKFYNVKKMFWDIEIYNEGSSAFPKPSLAAKPINAISFRIDGTNVVECFILEHIKMDKSKIVEINHLDFEVKTTIFETEQELLEAFCEKIRTSDIDVMVAWNGHFFDVPYYLNRMTRLGLNHNLLSPLNRSIVNTEKFEYDIMGIYFVDQLLLFKKTVQNVEVNYKLSTISQKYLGKDKVAYEGTLDILYETDINKFIEYSATDTNLLWELDNNLGHVELRFELIKLCSSTWKRAETTMGRAEPLLLSYAKSKGLVCKNKKYVGGFGRSDDDDDIKGAYVLQPIPGLHKWVVDFDFKSLYPSIMCSLNLGLDTYYAKIEPEIAKRIIYEKHKLPNDIKIKYKPYLEISKYEYINTNDLIKKIEDEQLIVSINGCIFLNHKIKRSFLSELLINLINRRDEYKHKMKDAIGDLNLIEDKESPKFKELTLYRSKYDIIQNALKIQVNACFTEDTEVVTLNGVKNIKDIKIGDELLNINKTTGNIEKDIVSDITINKYNGFIYHINNKYNYDFNVTADHKFVLNEGVKTASEIYDIVHNTKKKVKFLNPIEKENEIDYKYIINDYYSFIHYFKDKNSDIMLYIIPNRNDKEYDLRKYIKYFPENLYNKVKSGRDKKPRYNDLNIFKVLLKDLTYDEVDFLFNSQYFITKLKDNSYKALKLLDIKIECNLLMSFLGYFISEGSIYKNKPKIYENGNVKGISKKVQISQYKNINLKFYNEIVDITNKISNNLTKRENSIAISNSLLYDWLKEECYNDYTINTIKKIPSFILNVSKENKNIFLEKLYNGDGNKKGDINITKRYSTNSIYLRDTLMNIWISLGASVRYSTEIRNGYTCYRIVHSFKDNKTISCKNIKRSDFIGNVYCLTTEKNHTLYAGSNGKFIHTHNCYGSILNKYFRFYNPDLGEAITSTGQESLKYCIHHLNKYLTTSNTDIDYDFLDVFETSRDEYKYSITSDTDSLYIALGQYLSDNNKL